MASNDTPNILSAPLGTAGGGTIPANKVTYDGTGTSIEATNAQAAITELDTDLQSAKGDISDIKEILRAGYCLVDNDDETYAAEEGDDYGEMIDAVCAAIKTKLDAYDDKKLIIPYVLTISSTVSIDLRPMAYKHGDDFNVYGNFSVVYPADNSYSVWSCTGKSAGSSTLARATTTNLGAVTITDIAALTTTTGKTASLSYYVFEKA